MVARVVAAGCLGCWLLHLAAWQVALFQQICSLFALASSLHWHWLTLVQRFYGYIFCLVSVPWQACLVPLNLGMISLSCKFVALSVSITVFRLVKNKFAVPIPGLHALK